MVQLRFRSQLEDDVEEPVHGSYPVSFGHSLEQRGDGRTDVTAQQPRTLSAVNRRRASQPLLDELVNTGADPLSHELLVQARRQLILRPHPAELRADTPGAPPTSASRASAFLRPCRGQLAGGSSHRHDRARRWELAQERWRVARTLDQRRRGVSAAVLSMSMSLDGYIADLNESPERLHRWLFPGAVGHDIEAAIGKLQGPNRRIYDEFMSTGAVVAGRGTFEPAGGWAGDHHDGVPIFILSRNPAPAWAGDWANVHYVDSLEEAMREAKHAAVERDVLVHGASIAQRALGAGLLDEMEITLVPILMGEGRRLFDHLGIEPRSLERLRVLAGDDGVTHLRFRVARDASS